MSFRKWAYQNGLEDGYYSYRPTRNAKDYLRGYEDGKQLFHKQAMEQWAQTEREWRAEYERSKEHVT